jgi:biopolymer transport protein ExbD
MQTGMQRGQRLNTEPNITPMIDVLLVLLVIFIFKVPEARRAIMTALPDPKGTGTGEGIVLEVGPGDRLAINRQPVEPARLGATLRALYAGRPDKTILVHGDGTVTYQAVVSAIDSARGAGVRVIGLDPRRDRR